MLKKISNLLKKFHFNSMWEKKKIFRDENFNSYTQWSLNFLFHRNKPSRNVFDQQSTHLNEFSLWIFLIKIRSININFHYYRKIHEANRHFSQSKNCLDFFLLCVANTIHWKHFFFFTERKWKIHFMTKRRRSGLSAWSNFHHLDRSIVNYDRCRDDFFSAVVWMKEPPVSQPVIKTFLVLCATSTKKKFPPRRYF